MIRTLAGLAWRVHSPSNLELLSVERDVADLGARVFVRYDGRDWLIQYWSPSGPNVGVPFASRDEAIRQVREMAA